MNFDFDSAQKKLRECESVRRAGSEFVTLHRPKSPNKRCLSPGTVGKYKASLSHGALTPQVPGV